MAWLRRRRDNHYLHPVQDNNNFEATLVGISDEILKSELEKMKFILNSVIPGRQREKMKNAYEVFDYLKKRELIRENDVSNLVSLLKDIKRDDLATRLKQYHGYKRKPYKCIVVGDSGCGKTGLALRMMYNSFPDGYRTTIDPDLFLRNIYIEDKSVLVELWDTAGMEALTTVLPQQFFRDVSVVLLVFDITKKATFEHLRTWRSEVQHRCDTETLLFLVANKLDLEGNRTVTTKMGKEKAKEYGANYIEVSAKTGKNTEELLFQIGNALPDKELVFSTSSEVKSLSLDASTQTPHEHRTFRERLRFYCGC